MIDEVISGIISGDPLLRNGMPAEGLARAQKVLPRAPKDHPERRAAFDEGGRGRHRGHHDVGEEPAVLM